VAGRSPHLQKILTLEMLKFMNLKSLISTYLFINVGTLILLFLITISPASAQKVIRIVTFENAPYYSINLPYKGFLAQIVKQSFQDSGYKVAMEFRPFKRAYIEAQNGGWDAMMTLWYRPEREKFFLFSKPINTNELGFYSLKSNKYSIDVLEGKLIGSLRGTSVNQKKLIAMGAIIQEASNEKINMRTLLRERIDLWLVDKTTGKCLLKKFIPDRISELEWIGSIETTVQTVAFPKVNPNSKKLLEDFSAGFESLKRKGIVAEIRQSISC
jgi:polar amino acid transport system substrate-binding protein